MTNSTADEASAAIAVLPLGATEQHGPHLPPETDSLIAAGIVARLRLHLAPNMSVEFLPVEEVGYSPEHLFSPVTRSLPYDEAIRRWIAIGEAQAARGRRRFLMLNAHGGNSPLMTVVATELRHRFQMLAVATSWARFLPEGLVSPQERAIGIHGGAIETAVMLALHPDRVAREKTADFPTAQSSFARDFAHLRAYGPHAFGWMMTDLSPEGVTGNAAAATAKLGERLLDAAVTGLAELIGDMAAFDLSRFD